VPDRFERDILEYLRSWAPYGGPPTDEVWTEFGMTRDELVERAQLIIAAQRARHDQEARQPWLRVAPAGAGKRG
jgi:hypothetical protein